MILGEPHGNQKEGGMRGVGGWQQVEQSESLILVSFSTGVPQHLIDLIDTGNTIYLCQVYLHSQVRFRVTMEICVN